MRNKNLILFILIFNFIIAFGQNKSIGDGKSLKIEVIDTYTFKELAQKIVDIDRVISINYDSPENPKEKSHPLFSIFQLNLDNQNIPRPSAYLGFVNLSDTSLTIKYFYQSLLMPEGISYEWRQYTDTVFELIIHKNNEKKVVLNMSDIKSIIIDKNIYSDIDKDESYRFNFTDSENTIIIYLKKDAVAKIKELKQPEDVLIRFTICKRTFVLSLPINKIENGIYIKDNISDLDSEEFRLAYPSIIHHN
ncbi:MAG: hypothetical protein ACOYO1_15925 [Bacteroidales bacterium]